MCTPTHTTPTLITETLCLDTQVQLLLMTVSVPYTALANSYWVSVCDTYQLQGHRINDNDYSCHVTAVELD